MKRNKNSHISSLVSSNTRSKKKEKNISEFKTELNKKFYRRKSPTYESFDEPTTSNDYVSSNGEPLLLIIFL